MISISGAAIFALRTMRATRPSSRIVSDPVASLWCDTPNNSTALTPAARTSAIVSGIIASGIRLIPGMDLIGTGVSISSSTKIG